MSGIYTVRQVNSYIKNMFTQDFMLNRIYVKGEISNCKYHPSGHIYFSLKDESGTIACVMFAGSRAGLSFTLKNGQQVVAFGSVSVYERDGKYQLYAREIKLDGAGALYEKFEALKQELYEMGMFSDEYKQPIPAYVKTVGIVTAPTGAAVRDIINVAGRRNPYVQLILYPALVQGEGAVKSIITGIRMLEQRGVDVMIVGRGGGSIEELWAFNEEAVARAIFECSVPVISAVGHETDVTIADFVADLRAPTPSAAAELAVYEIRECKKTMSVYEDRLIRAVLSRIGSYRTKVDRFAMRLKLLHPRRKLDENRQFTAEAENKLRDLMERRLIKEKHRLALNVERMKRVSPLLKLSSGYSYIRSEEGKNIRSTDQVKRGEKLEIFVSDGKIEAEVQSMETMIHG